MFPTARLKALQRRKHELLCTSEAQRRLLTLECSAAAQRLKWVDSAVGVARRVAPFVGVAAPVLRAWSAHRNGERSWFAGIGEALPVASRLSGAVQQFMKRVVQWK
jgi:hypothetical protein